MNYYEVHSKTIEWADELGLLDPNNHKAQIAKVMEELGELCAAILKGNREKEKDSFGDLQVTIEILAQQRGVDLVECFEMAYKEIANRKGKMVDGSFIKDEDIVP